MLRINTCKRFTPSVIAASFYRRLLDLPSLEHRVAALNRVWKSRHRRLRQRPKIDFRGENMYQAPDTFFLQPWMTCVATRLRLYISKICDGRQKEKLRSALDQNWPRYISQYPADAPGVARTTSGPNGTIYNRKVLVWILILYMFWFHILCH